MPLIKCPDCSTEVSDQAPVCPRCGRPIATGGAGAPPARGSFRLGRLIGLVLLLATSGGAVLVAVTMYHRGGYGRATTPGAPSAPDLLHEVKESAAEAVGVNTAQKAAEQRNEEAKAAIRASNAAMEAWTALLSADAFPTVQQINDVRRRALEALTLAKAKCRAFADFVQQHRDDLRGLNADRATLNVPALEAAEAMVNGARLGQAKVSARQDWQGLGVSVEAGSIVSVWARGTWKPGPNWKPCGPEGTDEKSAFGDFRKFDKKLMSLVVRATGQPDVAFVGGAYGKFRAPAAGDLQARCNDKDTSNNDGEMEVLAIVSPPPS